MRRIYEQGVAHYEYGRTVVAGSWGGLGGCIAQDKPGAPMETIHLEPDRFRSVHCSSVMPKLMCLWNGWPPPIKRFLF